MALVAQSGGCRRGRPVVCRGCRSRVGNPARCCWVKVTLGSWVGRASRDRRNHWGRNARREGSWACNGRSIRQRPLSVAPSRVLSTIRFTNVWCAGVGRGVMLTWAPLVAVRPLFTKEENI
jgi:hypothetical protein